MSDYISGKKNILVTGGAGFLGSYLCERLLREGAHVICIDNFATSHPRNIENLLSYPNFQFLRLDINQPFDLESFKELADFKISFQGIQEIYHLACPMSIKNFDQFKIQTLLANSIGNYHVLEAAVKYRSKILLASSSVVYGPRSEDRKMFNEDDLGCVAHLTPRSCYDEGRRFSETMFETYRQVHGIDVKIARVFRTYGPRMPLFDGQLIPDFVLNALEGKDLVIYGDESFVTSLCYVNDMVDGLIRVMQAPEGFGPVNLGSDFDVKMVEVANKIIQMTASTSKIRFEGALLFLTELGLPNISKAKELGWLPLTRLEDGLAKTIEYIRANKILLTTLE
ncbi:MAG: NAD-dependent epimerase/dehydratase family protein [Candidatus Uhrbacteria bacterium GW2011_GWE2_45_35]|uniref:NAD-dependent epimerase/dehydratase family protein n=2 Tax=Candidatus Uhriibacteriota TaxID=1752732 RepID=A0A0G1JKQ8_9BACT|nr:MAG: NAD-dependent epimerase/dehydratase family protein [Candidatus Uhrbacteria bacterium GW2011_GWF2_44_350]KKU09168.1 MAG: NAD-dependent epimerase/dehydratase family protein [Candidatus Uhrbacteria bacterium GW2011_GWE2_45_35]HCU31200.1 NAD-dependent dehydratase [Candidatus Uhrbacteria bacterium]